MNTTATPPFADSIAPFYSRCGQKASFFPEASLVVVYRTKPLVLIEEPTPFLILRARWRISS